MTEAERYNSFLGKTVDIGIPNFIHKNRLFIINGKVIELDDQYMTLRIADGYRKIPYSDIIEIREKP